MAKVLLINPSWKQVYKKSIIKLAVPYNPVLSLATLAAPLIESGHEVEILDFNLINTNLEKTIGWFKPDFVGFTFATPMFPLVIRMCECIDAVKIGGGPHASALPEQTLQESQLDIVIVGEGDNTIVEIVDGKPLSTIKGLSYKDNDKIISNKPREPIKDLDTLPMPAWHMFDIPRYRTSKIIGRKSPLGFMETSRGCVYDCGFCNKKVHGNQFRVKSIDRVIREMAHMYNAGFKEIYIVDDGFTTDIKRAEQICEQIIDMDLQIVWSLTNGIRVDNVTPNLFRLLYEAGCYRVAFGIESGNQQVLDIVGKRTTLQQVRDAVRWANEAGIVTWGYFIIGLKGETEQSMKDTIRFAKSLNLHAAKFSILIPFPGCAIYDEWDAKGLIKTKNWDDYNMYNPKLLYNHPNLDWDTILKYSKKAFFEFYFRPKYLAKKLKDVLI